MLDQNFPAISCPKAPSSESQALLISLSELLDNGDPNWNQDIITHQTSCLSTMLFDTARFYETKTH